jgi:hypothetical protein
LLNFKHNSFAAAEIKQLFLMIACGIFITSLCFYPGTMDLDSIWQLDQANKNEYFDGHPPIMSYLWHWLDLAFPIIKGSATLFLFCVVMYSTALTLITFYKQKSTERRWLFFCAILFFPPAILILGFVIKDTLMDVNLLLAYAIMLHAEQKKSKRLLLISIIPLFIGFSTRYNSLFAVFPLCIWFGHMLYCPSAISERRSQILAILEGRFHMLAIKKQVIIKRMLSVGIGSLLVVLLFICKHFLESKVIHAEDSHSIQFLLAYDLVGVSVRSNENCLPSFYDSSNRLMTVNLLKKMYEPYTNYYTFWKKNPDDPTLNVIWNTDQEKELIHYWFKALKKHPKEMFFHKVDVYLSALGLMYKGAQLKSNELSSPIGISWAKLIPSRAMDGWVYLFILTLIWLAPIKLEHHEKALFWSGYLYGLSWVLSTPNTEQRYFSWVIMSSTIVVIHLCLSRLYRINTKHRVRMTGGG